MTMYYQLKLLQARLSAHEEAIDKANIDAFLNDEKNLNEHRFVVESILHDIKPYVEHIEFNKEPQILTNDHLYHLYTKIKGQLIDESYIGLLDSLHPTPALGGFPKKEAIEYIEQNEFGTRGLYGARLVILICMITVNLLSQFVQCLLKRTKLHYMLVAVLYLIRMPIVKLKKQRSNLIL